MLINPAYQLIKQKKSTNQKIRIYWYVDTLTTDTIILIS